MIAIVALRYLATSGAFAFLSTKFRPGIYAGLQPQILREIGGQEEPEGERSPEEDGTGDRPTDGGDAGQT